MSSPETYAPLYTAGKGQGNGYRVLVTGGREYQNKSRVYGVLDCIKHEHPNIIVIEGGAQGADRLAGYWSDDRGLPHAMVDAIWNNGKWAGHQRNRYMLMLRPDLVVAFPGGTGTADMVKQAKDARIDVMEIKDDD